MRGGGGGGEGEWRRVRVEEGGVKAGEKEEGRMMKSVW